MSRAILIIGESGSGKSYSIKTLNPDETFIIKGIEKDLPFKNSYKYHTPENPGNYITIDNCDKLDSIITNIIEKFPYIRNIVIDDFQYLMSKPFIKGMSTLPKGTKVYDMMTEIQTSVGIFLFKVHKYPNVNVIILTHSETDTTGRIKMKTLGKLLDEKVTIEGLFTVVLLAKKYAEESKIRYGFITNGDIDSVAKSPEGMFKEEIIPNDLNNVINQINNFYGETK